MGLLILVTGIFAGLFVAISTLYSIAQAMLSEGRLRWAHLAAVIAVGSVMMALQYRDVALARMLSVPLIAVALWAFREEERWFRIFPLLQLLFAGVVLAGFVAF